MRATTGGAVGAALLLVLLLSDAGVAGADSTPAAADADTDADAAAPLEDFDEADFLEPAPKPPPVPPQGAGGQEAEQGEELHSAGTSDGAAPGGGAKSTAAAGGQQKKGRRRRQLEGPFYLEAFACFTLLLFGANFLRGRAANNARAEAWSSRFLPLLEQEFALVGMEEGKRELKKESQSEYKCYASGRRYCKAMLLTMQLRKRQDLLHLLSYLSRPVHDTLTIEMEMEDSPAMPGFVFAMCAKRQEKEMRKVNADVRHYASRVKDLGAAIATATATGAGSGKKKKSNADGAGGGGGGGFELSEKLCVLTDCPELVGYFLTSGVQKAMVDGHEWL